MQESNKFLAIIPARKGSKRLPQKNKLPLLGKPLICWTIEQALKSKYLNQVIVSTDDEDIEKISYEYNIQVIKRPSHLAKDKSKTIDVVKHALKNIRGFFEYTILLQPTSPLRTTKDIDNSIELLIKKKADAIVSVCETSYSPSLYYTINKNLELKSFMLKEIRNKKTQRLYELNGAIYICKTSRLIKESSFLIKDKLYAYIMPPERSIDIDEKIDFLFAEFLLKKTIFDT